MVKCAHNPIDYHPPTGTFRVEQELPEIVSSMVWVYLVIDTMKPVRKLASQSENPQEDKEPTASCETPPLGAQAL